MCPVTAMNSQSRLLPWVVPALLLTNAVMLSWMAYIHSPTIDEGGHLPAGISHWHFAKFDIYSVNPHLVRTIAAIPVVLSSPAMDWAGVVQEKRPEWVLGQRMAELNGTKVFWYYTIARWACIPFSLLGGLVCYYWSRDLYGTNAGLLSLVLWTFSPNILGNAAQITPDAGAASFGIAAHYCLWRWLQHMTKWRMIIAGVVLGLTLLTKSTWIILFGLWPATWLLWVLLAHPVGQRKYWHGLSQLCGILLIGIYVLNAGYGFTGTFTKLGDYRFDSDALSVPTERKWIRTNRFHGSMLGQIPVPLPYDYVKGMDIQKKEFEQGKWCYLAGKHKFRGWWYFYLYAILVKTPIGTLTLAAAGAALTLIQNRNKTDIANQVALWLPAIALLTFVSAQTGFTIYLRYVLPVFPTLFIICGRCLSEDRETHRPIDRIRKVVSGGFAASVVVSSMVVYPHSLSYFNEAAGGPRHGHEHLIDANIDWGQDILLLKHWVEANNITEPIYVDLVSPLTMSCFEIDHKELPIEHGSGWFAISAHRLHRRNGQNAKFLQREPDGMIGYSIYLFHEPK